jgi:ABC-type Na+ efflux pump permease subunit
MIFDLSAVGGVLKKELRETVRDRNLVVNLVLVPVFLYPLIGFGAYQVLQIVHGIAERRTTVLGVGSEVPEAIVDSLAARPRHEIVVPPSRLVTPEVAPDGGDPDGAEFRAWREEVAKGDGPVPDALLVWHPASGEGGSDSALVYYDESRDRSVGARATLLEELDDWRRERSLAALARVGLGVADHDLWTLEEENTASATQRGQELLSMILPMILLLMLALGSFYTALDTVVGERERGTLETLLVSPLRRTEILLGKYLYVGLASVTTLLLNLASMFLFLGFVLTLVGADDIRVRITPGAFVLIVATSVLTAGFLSAVFMMASTPARTYREGQATLMPFYLVTILPGLAVVSSREPFTMGHALVPLLNSAALFKSALRGEMPTGPVAVTLLVLALATWVALAVASRIVAKEEIYVNPPKSLRRLFGGAGGSRT